MTTSHGTTRRSSGEDVVAEVTKLKQQPGRDILLYGSGQLFNTLLDHHLIDDFRLWVFPVVLGSGKRLFRDSNQPGSFQLAGTTTFSTGVVVLCYQQARQRQAASAEAALRRFGGR